MHRQQRGGGTGLPRAAALIGGFTSPRRRAISLSAASFLLTTALAAATAAHDGGTVGMTIAAERVPPGSSLPLIGQDWAPGEALRVVLIVGTTSRELGIVKTGPDGHFQASVPLPADVPSGPVDIEAISQTGVRDRVFVVVDPAAPPPPTLGEASSAAITTVGLDPVPIVALGLALGALVVLFVRTRRRTTH